MCRVIIIYYNRDLSPPIIESDELLLNEFVPEVLRPIPGSDEQYLVDHVTGFFELIKFNRPLGFVQTL